MIIKSSSQGVGYTLTQSPPRHHGRIQASARFRPIRRSYTQFGKDKEEGGLCRGTLSASLEFRRF
jgi:hypothetical protein